MNKFKKAGFKKKTAKFSGGYGGGRRGAKSQHGKRGGGRTEFFDAVCSECKQNCKVPFRPTTEKPVYCLACFRKQEHVPGRDSNGADARARQTAEIRALKERIDLLESKLDTLIEKLS